MEGSPFGRYRLLTLLGRGGMGEVWRAHDDATDRIVALKLLPAHAADDSDYQKRFRREAFAAASLSEPHVVPIHDFGEIDGRLYVDMRLIEGRDLQSMIAERPLTPQRAVRIIEQVASALEAAHAVGLVHRDVKPSNILVTNNDFAYLIDFGIAKSAGATKMTVGLVGTWSYMAPERFTTDDSDHRADVYSLACVLHECLTGTQPFTGATPERQMAEHLMTPPPRPSKSRTDLSTAFDDVIATGMAKDPIQRYQSAPLLAAAAQAALPAQHAQAWDPPDARDVRASQELQTFTTSPTESHPTVASPHPDASGPKGRRRKLTGTVVAIAAVIVIALASVTLVFTNTDANISASQSASEATPIQSTMTSRIKVPAPQSTSTANELPPPPALTTTVRPSATTTLRPSPGTAVPLPPPTATAASPVPPAVTTTVGAPPAVSTEPQADSSRTYTIRYSVTSMVDDR